MIVFKLASFSFRQIIGMRFYSLVLVKKNSPPLLIPILLPFSRRSATWLFFILFLFWLMKMSLILWISLDLPGSRLDQFFIMIFQAAGINLDLLPLQDICDIFHQTASHVKVYQSNQEGLSGAGGKCTIHCLWFSWCWCSCCRSTGC